MEDSERRIVAWLRGEAVRVAERRVEQQFSAIDDKIAAMQANTCLARTLGDLADAIAAGAHRTKTSA